MINFKIIKNKEEKEFIKGDFGFFFESVYEGKLSRTVWEHQFLNSPYDDSPLFLGYDDDKIIGSALMIRQKMRYRDVVLDYYLFTTSAVLFEYRPKGVYAHLLDMQKEYAKKNDAMFILAFPNDAARLVLRLFGGFKGLGKLNVVSAKYRDLDGSLLNDSLYIDDAVFNWRFEHNKYKFCKVDRRVIVYKKYREAIDILGIYKDCDIDFDVVYDNIYLDDNVILIEGLLKKEAQREVVSAAYPAYLLLDESIDITGARVNLLMSDVY